MDDLRRRAAEHRVRLIPVKVRRNRPARPNGGSMRFAVRTAARASFAVSTWFLTGAAVGAPVEPVHSLVQKEKPAVVETLRQLVTIESGSRDREGLDRVAQLIGDRLVALGGQGELREAGADAVRAFRTPWEIGKAVAARCED